MNFQEHLKGSVVLPTLPITQPNLITAPNVNFSLGDKILHHGAFIFTTSLMSAAPAVYSTPDIVNVYGVNIPAQTITHGVTPIQASAAPIKGCNK